VSWLRQAAFCASTRGCQTGSRFAPWRRDDRAPRNLLLTTTKWPHICEAVIADIAGNAWNGFAAQRLHRTAQVV
jgi:hypothetical protein